MSRFLWFSVYMLSTMGLTRCYETKDFFTFIKEYSDETKNKNKIEQITALAYPISRFYLKVLTDRHTNRHTRQANRQTNAGRNLGPISPTTDAQYLL